MVLTLLLEAWLNKDAIKEEWVERWLFCRGHVDTPYTKHIWSLYKSVPVL